MEEICSQRVLLYLIPGGPPLPVCIFISGTLGTVIGDFCSHNMGVDHA
jgi:hypothetical protein